MSFNPKTEELNLQGLLIPQLYYQHILFPSLFHDCLLGTPSVKTCMETHVWSQYKASRGQRIARLKASGLYAELLFQKQKQTRTTLTFFLWAFSSGSSCITWNSHRQICLLSLMNLSMVVGPQPWTSPPPTHTHQLELQSASFLFTRSAGMLDTKP